MLRRVLGSLLVCAFAAITLGQDDPELKPALADDHAAWVQRGVLKVIAPAAVDGETFTDSYELHEIRKIPGIDYTPNFEPKSQTVFEKAKQVALRRPVWSLEFAFKPVRMLWVDIPQPEGKMKKKLIWYMVYRVRNLGGHLEPLAESGQSTEVRDRLAANELDDAGKALAAKEGDEFKVFKTKVVDSLPKDVFPQVVFFPTIVLHAYDIIVVKGEKGPRVASLQQALNKSLAPSPKLKTDGDFNKATEDAAKKWQFSRRPPESDPDRTWEDESGAVDLDMWQKLGLSFTDFEKAYLERVIPAAMPEIAKRERVGKPIYDAVTISRQKIEVTTADKDNSVWGVATWEGVDPRTNFFSVDVQGLTNAYRFKDDAAGFKAGDTPGKGRTYERKTLALNFWRVGDTIGLDEKEVKYGMPVDRDLSTQRAVNAKYGEKDRLDYRWVYR